MTNKGLRIVLLIFALLTLMLSVLIPAAADDVLSFPAITETECSWDGDGNLAKETTHDMNGNPAMNSRGFCSAY